MMWRTGGVVLVAIMAGCAPVDSRTTRSDAPWYRSIVEPVHSDADRILKFYDRLTLMKPSELPHELEITREAFENDKSQLNRMQLALLLSYPGASFRDDNAAIALLAPFIKDKGQENSSLRPLAIWLNSGLLELRRAEEASQQQAAKFKDEQRRAEALQQKTEMSQQKAEALQQKLDAILEMEMKMIEREQSIPKKK